jgi:hypothetical protein
MENKKGFIIGIILAVVLPWLLIFPFLFFLTDTTWMAVELNAIQYIGVLSFQSFGFAYSVPIIGYSFAIPLLVWIVTGLVCGLIARKPERGLLCTVIGLIANIGIFKLIFLLNPVSGLVVDSLIQPLISGTLIDFIITLGIFLAWYSLILPGGSMGGLFGGTISRFRKNK